MGHKQTSNFFYYWFPVFFYCLLIFIQSSFPAPEQVPRFLLSDKLLHAVAYALLGALLLRAFLHSRYRNRYRFIFQASIFFAAFYGLTDELHQYFVPSRHAEAADLVFDCMGACIGVWTYHKLILRYPGLGRI